MARPARFSHDDVLDGAARAIAECGPAATIADVARSIGGPSGSIYHRFASRKELFGRLWLRAIGRFHAGLLAAYALDDPHAAVVASARHIPSFCRQHPLDARVMLLYRQSELSTTGPESLRSEAAHVNDAIDGAMADLVARRFPETTRRRSDLLRMATRLAPYGMVRPFIGRTMPDWLDDAVAASSEAIAALGDRDE